MKPLEYTHRNENINNINNININDDNHNNNNNNISGSLLSMLQQCETQGTTATVMKKKDVVPVSVPETLLESPQQHAVVVTNSLQSVNDEQQQQQQSSLWTLSPCSSSVSSSSSSSSSSLLTESHSQTLSSFVRRRPACSLQQQQLHQQQQQSNQLHDNNDSTNIKAATAAVITATSSSFFLLVLQEWIWFYLRLWCWTMPVLLLDIGRLILFVLCCAPGFLSFAIYVLVQAQATKLSVHYDTNSCRQTLDIYFPTTTTTTTTTSTTNVVVFFPGGAWMIGYKLWGGLLARTLTAFGICVVVADYRNYPIGVVQDMVDDVQAVVEWVIHRLPRLLQQQQQPSSSSNNLTTDNNIILVGESAGGHLLVTALLQQTIRYLQQQQPTTSLPLLLSKQIRGIITVSAPFDIVRMETTFQKHGLCNDMVNCIFGGDNQKRTVTYNPQQLLQQLLSLQQQQQQQQENNRFHLRDLLPPLCIHHGYNDKTVPWETAFDFFQQWKQLTQDNQQTTNANGQVLEKTQQHQLQQQDHPMDDKQHHATTISSSSSSQRQRQQQQQLFSRLQQDHCDKNGTIFLTDNENYGTMHNRCSFYCHTNWSHTWANLQGPMDGDFLFHRYILQAMNQWTRTTNSATTQDETNHNPQDKSSNNLNNRRHHNGMLHSDDPSEPLLLGQQEQQQEQDEFPSLPHEDEFPSLPSVTGQRTCPHLLLKWGSFFLPV